MKKEMYFDFLDFGGQVILGVTIPDKNSLKAELNKHREGEYTTNAFVKTCDALIYALNELYLYTKDNVDKMLNVDIVLCNQQKLILQWVSEGCNNQTYASKIAEAVDIMRFLAEEYGIGFELNLIDKKKNLAKKNAEIFARNSGFKKEAASFSVKLDFGVGKKVVQEKKAVGDNVVSIDQFRL